MAAVKSGAQRGARSVQSDTKGCETCVHCVPTMLFTLCRHLESRYKVGDTEDFHTIQHMRDSFVGLCGDEMRLRKERV